MVQCGERAGFAGKPLAQVAGIEVGEQQLERDEPVRVGVAVAGQVEDPIPPAPMRVLMSYRLIRDGMWNMGQVRKF